MSRPETLQESRTNLLCQVLEDIIIKRYNIGAIMELRREKKNDVTICCIVGEININTVPDLKVIFNGIIEEKLEKVLLNLEEVEYIDSLGLATLLFFDKGLKAASGKMIISNIIPKVGSIFKITKVDQVLTIFDAEEEALKHFE